MSDPIVVGETDHIRLLFRPAESNKVVITFTHMDFDESRAMFWGDKVIRSTGFAGFGVVAKTNNWFPNDDFALLAERARRILALFDARIAYGFSMGGYGAIKFSRALGTTSVIALSPQFSIDPADVGGHDERLVVNFSAALNTGMGIKQEDMAGRIHIVADPYERRDMWNVARIEAAAVGSAAALHLIRVPWMGHETIDVFANSMAARNLFRAAAVNDDARLERLAATLRRPCGRRVFNVLARAHARWPDQVAAMLERRRANLPPYWLSQADAHFASKPADASPHPKA